jgi:MFS transporter, DHA1 family, tetracycline resistance protein
MQQNHESTRLATDRSKISQKALVLLLISVFFDLLGVGILGPVIPFLVGQFDRDGLILGLLALSFSVAQFIATPALGILSDRYGRRPLLILSLVGTALGYFVVGFANALWFFFVARLIDGFTGGNISIAQAYVADVSSDEERAKNFGLIGAALGSGFIIGPALGGWLSQISLQTPAFVAGALSLLTTVIGFFILPESLPLERRRRNPISLKELNPLKQIGDALRRLSLRRFLLAIFVTNIAMSGLQTNFTLFTFVRFGLGPQENGWLFAYMGIVAIMAVASIDLLVKRFSEQGVAVVGLGLMILGFVGATLNSWMLYPSITLIAIGSTLSSTTLTSIISKRVSPDKQGAILGATQAVESLALIVGPVWAGVTFDYVGMNIPYWTGAGWLAIAMLLVSSILIV